ncbi:amidophosphoribosyltransferase [candidate division WOR-3 bacterium]|nr:amidophosphoribosyltransferase [candidate division WOR-3 bacterium]
MCGVVGILSNEICVSQIIDALVSIQHRGQDAAGAVTYDGKVFHLKKGIGLVRNVFKEKNINRLTGKIGLGHVRYPTIGSGSNEDAQPLYTNSPYGIAMVHNGNVANYNELKENLHLSRIHVNTSSDVEIILSVFAQSLKKKPKFSSQALFDSIKEVMENVKGGYSVVGYIANIGMFAFKDPHGIKPLFFAKKNGNVLFASETVVADVLEYDFIDEVKPGEAVWVPELTREISRKIIYQKEYRPCVFEWVYFARPDSIIEGVSVYEARYRMGKELGNQMLAEKIEADAVIPVPDTARTAALAIAERMNIPFKEGLIKNRYILRTFIMPDSMKRDYSLRHKLNPIKSEIKGKRIILVDDSIVRGVTSKKIISLVREAQASEIIFASTSPPIRHPCVYGIDMQTKRELIANARSIDEVRKFIGADQLFYLTIEGLRKSVSGVNPSLIGETNFCDACFSNNYPGGITEEELDLVEKERLKDRFVLSNKISHSLFSKKK